MPNVYLIPARDARGNAKRVPDPNTAAPLAAAGEFKSRSQYWMRRLAAGDVTEGAPPAVASKKPAVEKPDAVPATASVPAADKSRKTKN